MISTTSIILTVFGILITIVVGIVAWSVNEVVQQGKVLAGLKVKYEIVDAMKGTLDKLVGDVSFIRGRFEAGG